MVIINKMSSDSESDSYRSKSRNSKSKTSKTVSNPKLKKRSHFDAFKTENSSDEDSDIANDDSDNEDDDEDENAILKQKTKFNSKTTSYQDEESDEDDDQDDDENEDDGDLEKYIQKQKQSQNTEKNSEQKQQEEEEGDEDEAEEDQLNDEEGEDQPDLFDEDEAMDKAVQKIRKTLGVDKTTLGTKQVKKLTPQQLEKAEKKRLKTGVVYLSSIPPYMKPAKLRQLLSRFGEIGRLFLKPEDDKKYKRRVKTGGNKKKSYEEGWAEFLNKKNAKIAAETLNSNIIGGKKGSFYYDDILNIKYLKGFKWNDLTSQLNKEIEVREAKLQAELSQAHKLNKAFIDNVETSKMIEGIKRRKAEKILSDDNNTSNNNNKNNNTKSSAENNKNNNTSLEKPEIRRLFQQRSVTTNRAGAAEKFKNTTNDVTKNKKLSNVLSKIF
ncbi:hypothetical protein BVG19_g1812 [[Candida] boidinii]|nr:hypothetical protein BVG19_g1812 [[Candida] boidinii]OWB53159.1 hypothetical protein B5S27_g4751 [[Candida] boidinii]